MDPVDRGEGAGAGPALEAAPRIPPATLPLVEAVRAASAEARLSSLDALRRLVPDGDAEALLADSGAEDLRRMVGRRGTYYFSELSMTEGYAVHLFRLAERDLVLLVAETVRDDSRIYPRPTDPRVFLEPPFSLKPAELEETLGRMTIRPDVTDIKRCRASNGAEYLYSDRHLGEAHAASLTEWIEVLQKENP